MNISRPVVFKPPTYYEKYVSIKKCEAVQINPENKKQHIYLKGKLYYDTIDDNLNYDYSWAFVKIPEVSQPVKVRGLQHMNRAFDLDEVFIKMTNWL